MEYGKEWRLPESVLFQTCMSADKDESRRYIDSSRVTSGDLRVGRVLYTTEWGGSCHLLLLHPTPRWPGWWRVGWYQREVVRGHACTTMGVEYDWNCFDTKWKHGILQWDLMT